MLQSREGEAERCAKLPPPTDEVGVGLIACFDGWQGRCRMYVLHVDGACFHDHFASFWIESHCSSRHQPIFVFVPVFVLQFTHYSYVPVFPPSLFVFLTSSSVFLTSGPSILWIMTGAGSH